MSAPEATIDELRAELAEARTRIDELEGANGGLDDDLSDARRERDRMQGERDALQDKLDRLSALIAEVHSAADRADEVF